MPNLSFSIAAASSFTFCRPAVEYRALPEDFKYQLSRCAGGNLTWHEGQGRKTAGGRTVKLLQQPGTEGLQVRPRRKYLPNISVHLNMSLHWAWERPAVLFFWLNNKDKNKAKRFIIYSLYRLQIISFCTISLSIKTLSSSYIFTWCCNWSKEDIVKDQCRASYSKMLL